MAQQVGSQPRPVRRSQSPAERLLRALTLMLVVFIVATGSTVAVFAYKGRHQQGSLLKKTASGMLDAFAPASLMFDRGSRANILLVGEDVPINQYQQIVKEDSRADTNMLISLDQATKQVFVLSLPRDLRVTIPGEKGTGHKLNAAHRAGGVPKLIETIEANVGVTVHHYVKTNAHGFIELVDKVGGVDVDVERDMNYDDNWQDFHVHLKKGPQHLNGIQAQGYVRWRKNNNGQSDPLGDLGRVQRQQKCMRQLAAKILQPTMLPKFPSVLQAVRGYVQTDLSDRQLAALMTFLRDVDNRTIVTETLPCDYHKPFMYIRKTEAVPLLAAALGPTFDQGAILNAFDPKTAPATTTVRGRRDATDEDTGKTSKNGKSNGKGADHEIIEPDPGDDDTHVPPPPRGRHDEPNGHSGTEVKIYGDPSSKHEPGADKGKEPGSEAGGGKGDGGSKPTDKPKTEKPKPDKPKTPDKPAPRDGKAGDEGK